MAWRSVTVEDQREYLVRSFIAKQATMKELCEECGVSRKTGYKWYQRYIESGLKGLQDQSRAPLNPARFFSDEQIRIALEIKLTQPAYGPKKILYLLNKRYPEMAWPCATSLYNLFKENGLVSSRKLRRRVPRSHPLADVNASNDVWSADFKGWFKTQDGQKIEPLTITDGHTRFIIKCLHTERKRSEDIWKIYAEAFHEYGLPKRIRTDNGPPFGSTGIGRLSSLSVNLIKAGVTPEWINPGHPEENGRHERFHRSLRESIANPPATTFTEQISRMKVFVDEYNFERPHEALNQTVPGSHYKPSDRIWDGKLRSPEYGDQVIVRKVGQSGCIHWKQVGHYLGTTISGEYVALEEIDNDCFRVFYGPIFLGTLKHGSGFTRPVLAKEYWEL